MIATFPLRDSVAGSGPVVAVRGPPRRDPGPMRQENSVDHASFRRAAGQFASGIVVVTTRGGHAMTVSAFTSVSLDPPLVLFCAEKIARFHDAVLAEGSWAVSILAEDDEKTARWLATRGRPMDGQLDGGHRQRIGPLPPGRLEPSHR